MIKSLVNLKCELTFLAASNSDMSQSVKAISLSPEQWQILEELILVYKDFIGLTQLLGSELL